MHAPISTATRLGGRGGGTYLGKQCTSLVESSPERNTSEYISAVRLKCNGIQIILTSM